MTPGLISRRTTALSALAPSLLAILLLAGCDQAIPDETGEDTTPALGCADNEEMRLYVPPQATYLRVTQQDRDRGASNATPHRLSTLGIAPGDRLRLERMGEFQYDSSHPDLVYYGLLALFSSSAELLPHTELHRVPGALAAGEPHVTRPTFHGALPTDIPEDFVVGMARNGNPTVARDEPIFVTVPAGAQYLFLSPDDDLFSDNIDADEDFALCINIVD